MTSALSLLPPTTAPKGKRLKSPPKSKKKQRVQAETHRLALVTAIKTTEKELKTAYNSFNEVTDPDLVECFIFEINALQAQHNYLSRKLRQ